MHVTKTNTNNHLVPYLNNNLSKGPSALLLNLSVFYSLVKVTLMGLSAIAHSALIAMTKLINWTPRF